MATTVKPKTIAQLARDINKGDLKLGDVASFRRKSVENLMRIAKPESILAMATKDEGGTLEPKRDDKKELSRFTPGSSRIHNVRSW